MATAKKKCPICRRAVVAQFAPFCSTRCADEDLGRWMTGAYRIPMSDPRSGTGEAEEEDGAGTHAPANLRRVK